MVRKPPTNKPLHLEWKKERSNGLPLWLIWSLVLVVTAVLAWQAWAAVKAVDYRIQDDARQHIFWMLRYVDPELFPNDPIADYFQAMAPWLYRSLYAAGWQVLGIKPQDLALGLSPLLGLIAVVYAAAIGRHLSPLPWVSGLAGILCAQTLWMEDDLVSATPRAFATPLLLVFLYYALRCNPWGAGLSIFMQAGLYPPAALMSWVTASLRLSDRRNWVVWLASTVALSVGLLPLLLRPDPFGPMITEKAARSMLEFQAIGDTYGRAFFFHNNPLIFWGVSPRSGFLFWGLMAPLNIAVLGWLWLWRKPTSISASLSKTTYTSQDQEPLLGEESSRSPADIDKSPFVRSPLHPDSEILWQFAVAIVLLYGVAHLALFKLHFPARYPYHGFRTVLPIAAAIALVEGMRWQIRRWQAYPDWPHRLASWALVGLQLVLFLLPFYPELSIANQLYTTGRADELYEFLQATPRNTLVATLDKEGNNLPMFTERSLLVGGEYTLPYHPNYYAMLRQRACDLLAAYVATNPEPLLQLLDRYPITHLLIHKNSFTPKYLYTRTWLYPFQPDFDQAIKQLETQAELDEEPLLKQLLPTCTVLKIRKLSLAEADCIRDRLKDFS
ncbi:MAG: hypothetical protein AAFN08_13215 [Cyanobacteria bacterium J06559_3]